MSNCYCGNPFAFDACCGRYIKNITKAPSAEALMRSRYSAFATGAANYLVATTHHSTRKHQKEAEILHWSQSNQWVKLEILAVTKTTVTFKAFYLDYQLKAQIHYEKSNFIYENGCWFYVDGDY